MRKENCIVNINALQEGSYHYDFQLEDDFFIAQEGSGILGGDVLAKADLQLNEWGGQLSLQVSGRVSVACDRCLEPMWEQVAAEEVLQLKISATVTNDEDIFINPQDGELDLGWLFYELITIHLPIVHRHQTGECNPQMEELLQAHLCTEEDKLTAE